MGELRTGLQAMDTPWASLAPLRPHCCAARMPQGEPVCASQPAGRLLRWHVWVTEGWLPATLALRAPMGPRCREPGDTSTVPCLWGLCAGTGPPCHGGLSLWRKRLAAPELSPRRGWWQDHRQVQRACGGPCTMCKASRQRHTSLKVQEKRLISVPSSKM